MATFVLTAIGDDRAGLVNALADAVTEHGGNWERSQMAELAGKFAGIVLVTVPDASAARLLASLQSLDGILEVHVHRGGDESTPTRRLSLDLIGGDRPGIVREITAVLTRHGVSIEQLTTATREAPMAGGVLFEAQAILDVRSDTTAGALRDALEAVANELMVDIDVDDL